MTLYWPPDPNQLDLTGPRLHAFIVGAGSYPHLDAGVQNAFNTNFGLQQLTTTVFTARKIAEWLVSPAGYRNPQVPLGSVELFLSPAQQMTRPDGTQVLIEEATLANIAAAFRPKFIQQRCMAQPGGISLFYFAGHGLAFGGGHYLLPSDFADPQGTRWDRCIDFTRTRSGMGHVQNTQLFFVDACRETPIDILTQANPPTGVRLIDDASLFDHPDAEATYYAAADGRQAFGPDDDVTYFSSALIESLDGAGALNRNGKFTVDTFSLSNALGQIVNSLAGVLDKRLTCNPQPSGVPAAIHHPLSAHVRTTIRCQTDEANRESSITLRRGGNVIESEAGKERPWVGKLPPGDWDVNVKFNSFPEQNRQETLIPPLRDLELEV